MRTRPPATETTSDAGEHVLVVGGGFGGLTVARALADLDGPRPLRITLVDQRNHHTFQPLLYQVATAGLAPQDVGHPLRPIFGRPRTSLERWRTRGRHPVHVRLGAVTDIDRVQRTATLDDGSVVQWDRLVVAAGAVTNDFGLPGVTEHGFGLKSLGEAVRLRDHILACFEAASADPRRRTDGTLNFVVAGGGATGVELAGAIAELVNDVLRNDHPDIGTDDVQVILVEMGQRLLAGFHRASSDEALRALRSRGVQVRLATTVERVEADHVQLADGRRLPTRTLMWVAGVAPSRLATVLASDLERGRVVVTDHLALPGDDHVHVIGDMAAGRGPDGALLPQVAPVAMQQARHVAAVVAADLSGDRPPPPFRYVDKGSMATIGRSAAVAELPGGIRLDGWPAWTSWLVLHLVFLVGFRNRTAVALSWLHNWFTHDRSHRLVLDRDAGDTGRPEHATDDVHHGSGAHGDTLGETGGRAHDPG